jgi:hypothetical protein
MQYGVGAFSAALCANGFGIEGKTSLAKCGLTRSYETRRMQIFFCAREWRIGLMADLPQGMFRMRDFRH